MPTESDLGRRVYPSELGQSVMDNDSVRLVDESIKRLLWPTAHELPAGRIPAWQRIAGRKAPRKMP